VHTRNKPLAEEVSLKEIARATPGFTGADLENVVNEAALLTARTGGKKISKKEIEEAGRADYCRNPEAKPGHQ